MSNDFCPSTHGGAGYAEGSYWDGDAIICGDCGFRIENPAPTGAKFVKASGIRGLFGKGTWEPTWPKWIGTKPPNEKVAGIPDVEIEILGPA